MEFLDGKVMRAPNARGRSMIRAFSRNPLNHTDTICSEGP